MEICMQKVNWRVSWGSTLVKEWGQQSWAEGEVELWNNYNKGFSWFMRSSSSGAEWCFVPYHCPVIGCECGLPLRQEIPLSQRAFFSPQKGTHLWTVSLPTSSSWENDCTISKEGIWAVHYSIHYRVILKHLPDCLPPYKKPSDELSSHLKAKTFAGPKTSYMIWPLSSLSHLFPTTSFLLLLLLPH
jgi:hypothetical protein